MDLGSGVQPGWRAVGIGKGGLRSEVVPLNIASRHSLFNVTFNSVRGRGLLIHDQAEESLAIPSGDRLLRVSILALELHEGGPRAVGVRG